MALGDIDTSTYGPASNYGSDAVEAWRPSITKAAGTLPVEFLLAWIGPESGGDPCALTPRSEAGVFQLDTGNVQAAGTTTAGQHPEPPCTPGRICDFCGTGFSSLTADQANEQVNGGVNYVNWCVNYTDLELAKYGFSIDTSTADYWSFVKMCHVGTGYMDQLLQAAVQGNGGTAPGSWADTLSAAASSGSPYAYLANASGTHTASIVGQYGAGSNSLLNAASNAAASIPNLTLAEWLLIGLAAFGGIAGAFFFQRWLAAGEGAAVPLTGRL